MSNPCAMTLIYIFFVLDLLGRMFENLQQIQCDTRKIDSNTDPLVELEKIASGKGFVISDNEGSGNCMFHALSEQLNLVKGIKISHKGLRQSIVQYLLNNPRLVSLVFLFVGQENLNIQYTHVPAPIHAYCIYVYFICSGVLCSLNYTCS